MPGVLREPRLFHTPPMCEDTPARLKAADLQALAARHLVELQAEGSILHPVINTTRKLARNFWGTAWMKQLAHCESGGLCLAPGRTLLRHGCVLDLQISRCKINALVSTDRVYDIELTLTPLAEEQLHILSSSCNGHIDSLLSLLEGKLEPPLLKLLCDPEKGILPTPADWQMNCSCPDWAEPCPHAAAAIYAAGCLIDDQPELLFTLRGMEPERLIQEIPPAPILDPDSLSATFGIEIEIP